MGVKSEMAQLSRRKRLVFSVVLFLAGVLLCELSLQVVFHSLVRGLYRDTTLAPTYGPELAAEVAANERALKLVFHPFTGYMSQPNQDMPTLHINALGLRGKLPSSPRAAGETRILMLGGSTTLGSGASSDETTIPALLEKELRRAGTSVEVVNCGVSGFVSWQELVYLTTELMRLEPDFVVFYDGANDAYAAVDSLIRFSSTPLEIQYRVTHPLSAFLLEVFDSVQLVRIPMNFIKSRQMRAVKASYSAKEVFYQRDKPEIGIPSLKELDARAFMDQVRALEPAFGFKSLYVLQPTLEDVGNGKPLSDMEKRIEEHFANAQVRKQMAPIYDGFRRVYGSSDDALDLSRLFNENPATLYCDTVHLNDHGNLIVAHAIADAMISRLSEN